MGSFSIWHWLIVLGIVILVFGTRKLRDAGGDLGSAIRKQRRSSPKLKSNIAIPPEPALRPWDRVCS